MLAATLQIARRLYSALPARLRDLAAPVAGRVFPLLARDAQVGAQGRARLVGTGRPGSDGVTVAGTARPDGDGPQLAGTALPGGDGVTIVGMFSSPCGIGEGARLCADALARLGWRVERVDLAPALGIRSLPALRFDPDPRLTQGPVIVHLNPPLFGKATDILGRRRLRGRAVIGYWAWELEHAPPGWRRAARGLHEVWTPSHFSADALHQAVRVPVRVVPHPVPRRPAVPDRARFKLPDGVCIFLTFANLQSNLARKNPQATLEAYARAFPVPREDILLLVKLDGEDAAPHLVAGLLDAARRCTCPVRFIVDPLAPAERDTLIASCDVLVSLHRSESFGLTLAKAMTLGRPVVATAWSGNLDYMRPAQAALVGVKLVPVRNPQGFYDPALRWAEPDVAEAANWLRRLAASRGLRENMASMAAALNLPRRFEAALRDTCLWRGDDDGAGTAPEVVAFPAPQGPQTADGRRQTADGRRQTAAVHAGAQRMKLVPRRA
jgi:glycosyltransferase involved in cell wall biosynthesis